MLWGQVAWKFFYIHRLVGMLVVGVGISWTGFYVPVVTLISCVLHDLDCGMGCVIVMG